MTNGTPTELHGPLARMWRDVYRKAAGVAEARTTELLKYHVYLYPHGGVLDDLYVNETGDTMTGTLTMQGDDVLLHGGLKVYGPPVAVLGGEHLYGATTPAFGAFTTSNDRQWGVRFRSTMGGTIAEVRWYNPGSAPFVPDIVHLWDTRTPALPQWSFTGLGYTDPAAGWKTKTIPDAERPAPLVAGVDYVLAFDYEALANFARTDLDYTPVPDSPLVFLAHVRKTTGDMPDEEFGQAYLVDLGLGESSIPGDPALSGAIRLPTGPDATGRIAWRNAENTADNWVSFDADDRFLINGVPIGSGGAGGGNTVMHTQTSAPAGAPNSLWFNPSESA